MTIDTRRVVYLSQADVTDALIQFISKYDPDILLSPTDSVVVEVTDRDKTVVSWNRLLDLHVDKEAVNRSAEELLMEEMEARERGPFQIDDPAKTAGSREGVKTHDTEADTPTTPI